VHDIIVVGAGPSGCFAAMKCAQQGLDVLLIDAEKFPRDKACGGVVGEKAIELIGKDVLTVVERESKIIEFFYDWKYIGHLDSHEYFFKRLKFDHFLVRKAVDSAAILKERTRALGLTVSSSNATVHTTAGDLQGKLVIGADGTNSVIGRSLNLCHHDDVCRYASLKAEIDVTQEKAKELGVEDPPRQATYFFSDLIGFAWVIPNNGSVNAGYGSTVSKAKGLKERFHKFLGQLDLKPQCERGAQIPFLTVDRVYSERVLLTGDAAGFVNPWTGSGIDDGIIASNKAVAVCKEAIDLNDYSIDVLCKYQVLCRNQMRKINWRGHWIKALDSIVPEKYEFPFWVKFLVRKLATLA